MPSDQNLFMLEPQAIALLRHYGIRFPESEIARDPEEAGCLADRLGYPVVLKVVSPDVVHKSDAGGVLVGLSTQADVVEGYRRIVDSVLARHPHAVIEGVLVVRQAETGLEAIVGALRDPMLGPAVMFGLGGVFAEVLKDVSFRVVPLRRRDAQEMIAEIRGFPLLKGARGGAAIDQDALVKLLLAVSRLMNEHPEIVELDLNPVRLYRQGLLALDARLMVTPEPVAG